MHIHTTGLLTKIIAYPFIAPGLQFARFIVFRSAPTFTTSRNNKLVTSIAIQFFV